jgi:protein Tob/BTG
MKFEIHVAANFLTNLLLRGHNSSSRRQQLGIFKQTLEALLFQRYKGHWYPEDPERGTGYRCIDMNRVKDESVVQSGRSAQIKIDELNALIPSELRIWVDPSKVSFKLWENSKEIVLFDADIDFHYKTALLYELTLKTMNPNTDGLDYEHDHHLLYAHENCTPECLPKMYGYCSSEASSYSGSGYEYRAPESADVYWYQFQENL